MTPDSSWVLCVLALDALGLMTGSGSDGNDKSHMNPAAVDLATRRFILQHLCGFLPATVHSPSIPHSGQPQLQPAPALYWLRRSVAEAIGRLAGGTGMDAVVWGVLTPLIKDPHRHGVRLLLQL